jgi:uncharacterized membrane protein
VSMALQRLQERHASDVRGGWTLRLLNPATLGYRLLTMFMALFWIQAYVPDIYLPGFLGLGGLGAALWGLCSEKPLRVWYGFLLIAIGLVVCCLDPVRVAVTRWTDLIVILAPAVLQQVHHRQTSFRGKFRALDVAGILLTVFYLWLFIGRWVTQTSAGFYLSASWSVLALAIFGVGLLLKERTYRLSGLFMLACTVVRIVFVELWQFGALSRILSLMVCGAVLGVLGFIYNRYAETIRKYL